MLRTPRPRRAAGAPAPGAARPRRLLALVLLAAVVAAPLAAAPVGAQPTTPPVADQATIAGQPLADPSTSREVPRLAVEIFEGVMSPFCPGLLLSNCPSPYADSLRNAIVERVERGDTRAEIEAELYATYGEAVRAAPKTSGFGLVAWLAPAVVLLGGGLWLALWLRRASTRRARPATPPAGPALVPAGGAALLLGAGAACASADGDAPPPPATGFRGVTLVTPLEKPAGTFTTTAGEPYDLRAETKGYVTLVFFGYTHCPDVCPVHMANLAAVLRQAEPEVRSRVKVVFVTTDPERDTPERLRTWLAAFDPSFVGIVGPDSLVREAQVTANIAPAFKQPLPGVDADSAYGVGHGSQVVAYSPSDDRAHVLYPFGTRQQDWAADLPKLVSHEWD